MRRARGEAADEYDPETGLIWILFEYYNHLMGFAEAWIAAAHGDAVVTFFRSTEDRRFEAMFLELVARTRRNSGELDAGRLVRGRSVPPGSFGEERGAFARP